MASVYNLEPQPTAKCVLHTTSGDISLELFAQQTPLASRNFLQLCLDGYYDNTIFHRLVPGFIIQGGDPTGTGSGGSSCYDGGRPFADEFHSRLKFNRRGLLGMANTGSKDDNGSQFFLTLGKTEELTGRSTLFGRVEGDTIFNVVKMGEADLAEEEGAERPMYPTRITGTDVLVNPFEDMAKRAAVVAHSRSSYTQDSKKKAPKKSAAKGLLSFAADEDEDGNDISRLVAHKSRAKFNTNLVGAPPAAVEVQNKRPAPDGMKEQPRKRRASPSPTAAVQSSRGPASATVGVRAAQPVSPSSSSRASPELPPKLSALERANQQIEELRRSLKRNVATVAPKIEKKKTTLESMIPLDAVRGRRRKGGANGSALGGPVSREEQRTLDQFNAFRKRLEAAGGAAANRGGASGEKGGKDSDADNHGDGNTASNTIAAEREDENDDEALLCDLHFVPNCQSCKKWDQEDEVEAAADHSDDDDKGWLTHRLTFEKDRLGKDLEWKRQNEKELVVIDPREKEKDIKASQRHPKKHATNLKIG